MMGKTCAKQGGPRPRSALHVRTALPAGAVVRRLVMPALEDQGLGAESYFRSQSLVKSCQKVKRNVNRREIFVRAFTIRHGFQGNDEQVS